MLRNQMKYPRDGPETNVRKYFTWDKREGPKFSCPSTENTLSRGCLVSGQYSSMQWPRGPDSFYLVTPFLLVLWKHLHLHEGKEREWRRCHFFKSHHPAVKHVTPTLVSLIRTNHKWWGASRVEPCASRVGSCLPVATRERNPSISLEAKNTFSDPFFPSP